MVLHIALAAAVAAALVAEAEVPRPLLLHGLRHEDRVHEDPMEPQQLQRRHVDRQVSQQLLWSSLRPCRHREYPPPRLPPVS